MPIFVEWKWTERSETFLVVFHFWAGKKGNLRTSIVKEDINVFAVCDLEEYPYNNRVGFVPVAVVPLDYDEERAYLTWAPSHPELALLTEVLTYANLINGQKPEERRKFKPYLEGKVTKWKDEQGRNRADISIDSGLLAFISFGSIVSFASQDGISFELRYEYLEYLRSLMQPHLKS